MVYAVIGQGKLASHLCHWLKLENLEFVSMSRNSDFSKLTQVDIILLAVSDSSVETFYNQHPQFHIKRWIHFSGTVDVEGMLNLHPMMSFSSELFEKSFYRNLCWVTTNSVEDFKDLLPITLSQIKELSLSHRRKYHALCVLAGNIPHLIWNDLEPLFQELQIEKEDFHKYVKVSTENFLQQRAPTGPIVRRDFETIETNLASLPIEYQKIYKSVLELTHEKY